jgi:mono/diheme cytochrome c family protein
MRPSRYGKRQAWALGVVALLVGTGVWVSCQRSADGQIHRKALRPGLVAAHQGAGPGGATVVQIEPTIALALKAGESTHPRLSAAGGRIRWDGFLNVVRAGDYRFSAVLRGKLRVAVAGKVVVDTALRADTPGAVEGPATHLEPGIHPLSAEFTRLPGAARVELSWQAAHFHREPLPHSVLGHLPDKAPPALGAHQQQERGRFLVEELSCLSCHRPDDKDRMARGLQTRPAPDLSAVGGRIHVGWIYHWLTEAPDAHPGRVMPQLFARDAGGRAEAYAVTRYLASLGGPLRSAGLPPPKPLRASVERGRRLFIVTGCIVCHNDPGTKDGPPRGYSLSGLGARTTPEKLAHYLANPLAVDPSGRMPHMLLTDQEARDLASYLGSGKDAGQPGALPEEPTLALRVAAFKRVDPRPDELTAFRKLAVEQQWLDLGKRLVIDRGCNNCHTIAPGGQPFANQFADSSFEDIKKPEKSRRGCLASEEAQRGQAPRFALAEAERAAIRAFLKEGTHGAGSLSPLHAARVALQRFNCLACHQRDGQGGLTPEVVRELRRHEKAEDAEAFTPPPLTGVGHKLLTPWFRKVLTGAGRARSWLGLRMPQFGPANIGALPEALTALDGAAVQDKPDRVAPTPARIKAGRLLVGKTALGCISCHDLAGIPSPGTRGPDLALSSERVRYRWYRRWLESAQRMQPGTKMPTVFPEGKSLQDNILNGNADAQAEAMWAYLSLGPTLPLPEGLQPKERRKSSPRPGARPSP